MSNPIRILIAVLLAALSGVFLFLAFPPYNLWWLMWFAFLPSIVAQYRIIPRRISALVPAITVGGWLGGYLYPIFAGSGLYMEWLPVAIFGLNLLTESGTRPFHERTNYRFLVPQQALGWVGIELIRNFIPIAGTWGFLAYTQHQQVWLIQPVSVFTIFGLSLLIMTVNYALGLGALRWLDARWTLDASAPRVDGGLARRTLTFAAAAAALWVALSLALLKQPTGPSITAAAVQSAKSSLIVYSQGRVDEYQANIQRMKEQTRSVQGADLVVWPEGGLLYDPQAEDPLDLPGLARETGAHLAVGYIVKLDERAYRNEATVVSPAGEFLGVYGKDHPVTFAGETSPTRGTYPVYDTPIGKLATIICYDLDFTDTARKMARQGAQIIAVPSNDWSAIAAKHYTHVIFRAVENRVAMVKADGGFDSAIIDPFGRVRALAVHPEGAEAAITAEVPIGTGKPTIAALLPDWAGWLSLAGMIAFMVVDARSKKGSV